MHLTKPQKYAKASTVPYTFNLIKFVVLVNIHSEQSFSINRSASNVGSVYIYIAAFYESNTNLKIGLVQYQNTYDGDCASEAKVGTKLYNFIHCILC